MRIHLIKPYFDAPMSGRPITILIAMTITCAVPFWSSCKYKGCTDPYANNYSAEATKDDGSCTYDEPQGAQSLVVGVDCASNNGIDFSAGTAECAGCSQDTSATASDVYFTEPVMGIVAGDSCWGKANLSIVSVGEVCCLGAINEIPGSGFSNQVAPAEGNGYVVKTREGKYARVYIVDFTLDSYGEVAEAEMRFQYPFEP
jgi:hypothetical protein